MATIRTAIQITDGMSPAFKSMNNAMNIVLSSFESLQRASSKAIDTHSIQAARVELNKAEIAFNQIEQEIRAADQAQQKLNNDMLSGGSAAGGFLGKIKGVVGALGLALGANQLIGLSDSMTSTIARLDLMNDGLQTTAELQDKIFQSAQRSRSAYMDTAAAAAKLGILAKDSFSSNDEIIAFTELMNKQFKIGGAGIQEQQSAMYQLTQAMASGKLQGDEFRSIMENAPMLAQAIAQYTGKSMGDLKKMGAEGQITAAVIKNAMFQAADETNRKFTEMPMTFSQVGTVIGNTLLQTFNPVIQGIGKGAQVIYDNWSILEPIFWGLTVALGAYAIMTGVQTAATWLAVAANRALIVTMLTNPVLWIALAIGVLIGMIYKWVQSVGGIQIAWAIASNVILTAWDRVQIGFMQGVNAVQTHVGNLRVSVLNELQSMANGAIDIINGFINAVNKIPGVGISTISQVSFATEAAIKNDAAISARNAGISQMEAEASWNAAQRQYNIRSLQNGRSGESDFASLFNNVNTIAANTGSMKDSMEASQESIEYLRDLAEQEVINRFTTAEVKVDFGGMTNHISSTMDLDGVVGYLSTALEETLASVAEGV